MYWDNYNFKYDAEKVRLKYTGDYNSYVDCLLNSDKGVFSESEYSVTMNFVRFCHGVAEVKKREYRDDKINSLLS